MGKQTLYNYPIYYVIETLVPTVARLSEMNRTVILLQPIRSEDVADIMESIWKDDVEPLKTSTKSNTTITIRNIMPLAVTEEEENVQSS